MAISALCIPLFAGLSQWYSTKLMMANQSKQTQQAQDDNPAASMMKSMNITMPLMSVFFCFTFASGYRTVLGGSECVYHYPAGRNQLLFE